MTDDATPIELHPEPSDEERPRFRVPPHNLEAEESVLGAMLLSRDALAAAGEARLHGDDFYKPAHTAIFDASMDLYQQGEPVDPVTVAEEMRSDPAVDFDRIGGRRALLRLQAATPASANAAHYSATVKDKSIRRKLIMIGGEIAEMGYDEQTDLVDMLDRAEAGVFAVAERDDPTASMSLVDALGEELDRMETRLPGLLGVPTGYHDLDRLTLGLQPAQLLVLAARPGMGKSALVLGAGANVATITRQPVLLFSLEMTRQEIVQRLLASTSRVGLRRLQTYSHARPNMSEQDWSAVSHAVGRLSEIPLEIDDSDRLTVMDIRAKARRTKARHGALGLIIVDYVQLMTPVSGRGRRDDNRQNEVAEISRGLKMLARELECPVLALAQLNRQVEARVDKRPILADLRDSGALEQDADIVAFIYRDEVYNKNSPDMGTAEVKVAKHRNGPTGTVRLKFLPELTRFDNLAGAEPDPLAQPMLELVTETPEEEPF